MSIKVKALLLDNVLSRTEQDSLERSAQSFQNYPCEMKFEAYHAWMDHENSAHEYLPVFHLLGHVTEIRFEQPLPYGITSVYFDEKDRTKLLKDILYYPNPDELAHLIKTGKYFTKHFAIPQVLYGNTYDFPAVADVMVLPPVASEEMDQLAVPLVYLGLNGTGVSRKNDKLLDYYGIDFDPQFPMYALSAESSGYVNPSLMMYMEEPVIQREDAHEIDKSEYYITPEEEAQLMNAREMEAQPEPEVDVSKDFRQPDMEDVLLASADRAITRRVEQKWLQKTGKDVQAEPVTEPEISAEVSEEHVPQETVHEPSPEFIQAPEPEGAVPPVFDPMGFFASGDLLSAPPKKTEASVVPVPQEAIQEPQEEWIEAPDKQPETVEPKPADATVKPEAAAPDAPEQMKEVRSTTANSETGDLAERLHPEAQQVSGQAQKEEEELLEQETDDDAKATDKGDVSDVKAQKKLNEKQARMMLRESAQQDQQELADAHTVGRSVSDDMEDVTQRYDASRRAGTSREFGE